MSSRFGNLEAAVRYLAERVLGENLDISEIAARDTPQPNAGPPEPLPVLDMEPFLARLAALETAMPTAIDVGPLIERIKHLESRSVDPAVTTGLDALVARVARAEQALAKVDSADMAPSIKNRLDMIEMKLEQLIASYADQASQVAKLKGDVDLLAKAFQEHSHDLKDKDGNVLVMGEALMSQLAAGRVQ